MKKAKKKDNPGENIGNALLGCGNVLDRIYRIDRIEKGANA